MQIQEEILSGGNMNSPFRKNQMIYKDATQASQTIHELLTYVRARGVTWVPESKGINPEGKHVLTYLEGEVPHDTPEWLWEEATLTEAAIKLRQWHDASVGFESKNGGWLLKNDEEQEVICHNDFAPYNCVFRDKHLIGVIDFDVCSPGSRIWDIAYTVYRFVPLFPIEDIESYGEISPFTLDRMIDRLERFLEDYSKGETVIRYSTQEVVTKVVKRLFALADWSEQFGMQTQKEELTQHARMYRHHATWLNEIMTNRLLA